MDTRKRYPQGDLCTSSLIEGGSYPRIRTALVTTDIDDSDMAAADSIGIWDTNPSNPNSTGSPAAMGMQTAL